MDRSHESQHALRIRRLQTTESKGGPGDRSSVPSRRAQELIQDVKVSDLSLVNPKRGTVRRKPSKKGRRFPEKYAGFKHGVGSRLMKFNEDTKAAAFPVYSIDDEALSDSTDTSYQSLSETETSVISFPASRDSERRDSSTASQNSSSAHQYPDATEICKEYECDNWETPAGASHVKTHHSDDLSGRSLSFLAPDFATESGAASETTPSPTTDSTPVRDRILQYEMRSQETGDGHLRTFDPVQLMHDFRAQKRLELGEAVEIIDRTRDIFSREPNILRIKAPLTIVGDVHGQFFDLCTILTDSYGRLRILPEHQYLFLGDYVDRGAFGCEVMLFLAVLKICYPSQIHLIRGNHECASVTGHFGFQEECARKYSDILYYRFVLLFQTMPLCAVLDTSFGRMFAVHGGISPTLTQMSQIDDLNRFVEPDSKGLLCDLLWADPLSPEIAVRADLRPEEQVATEWVANPVRGCSYCFGIDPLERFLRENNFVCLIRAHEVQEQGFAAFARNSETENGSIQEAIVFAAEGQDDKLPALITVFSAPNYCDRYGNMGAVLHIDRSVYIKQYSAVPHPEPAFVDSQADLWTEIIQKTCPYMPFTIYDFVQVALEIHEMNTADLRDGVVSRSAVALVGGAPSEHDAKTTREESALHSLATRIATPMIALSDARTESAGSAMDLAQPALLRRLSSQPSPRNLTLLSKRSQGSLFDFEGPSGRSMRQQAEDGNQPPSEGHRESFESKSSDFSKIAASDAINEMSPDAVLADLAHYETEMGIVSSLTSASPFLQGSLVRARKQQDQSSSRERREEHLSGDSTIGESKLSFSTAFTDVDILTESWTDQNPMHTAAPPSICTSQTEAAQYQGRMTRTGHRTDTDRSIEALLGSPDVRTDPNTMKPRYLRQDDPLDDFVSLTHGQQLGRSRTGSELSVDGHFDRLREQFGPRSLPRVRNGRRSGSSPKQRSSTVSQPTEGNGAYDARTARRHSLSPTNGEVFKLRSKSRSSTRSLGSGTVGRRGGQSVTTLEQDSARQRKQGRVSYRSRSRTSPWSRRYSVDETRHSKGSNSSSSPSKEHGSADFKASDLLTETSEHFLQGGSPVQSRKKIPGVSRPVSEGVAQRVTKLTRGYAGSGEKTIGTYAPTSDVSSNHRARVARLGPIQDTSVVLNRDSSNPQSLHVTGVQRAHQEAQTIAGDAVQFTREELLVIRFIFSLFDRDDDSFLDPKELQKLAYETGDWFLQPKEIEDIMTAVDRDRDGRIGLVDFIALAAQLKDLHKKQMHAALMQEIRSKKGPYRPVEESTSPLSSDEEALL